MEPKQPPKTPQDRIRFVIALILSFLVFSASPFIVRYFNPKPPAPPPPVEEEVASSSPSPSPTPGASPASGSKGSPSSGNKVEAAPIAQPILQTQASPRSITIETAFWKATLSNRGGVINSWILERHKDNGAIREIKAADGSVLELVPQETIERYGAPFRLLIPWSPELTHQLNNAYFEVSGLPSDSGSIVLTDGEQRELTFTFASGGVVAKKTFTFYGDSFLFDTKISVSLNGQPVESAIVIGPRIGDQKDKLTGSYSTPPQMIAYTIDGDREAILGAAITPAFTKVVSIDHGAKKVVIEEPLAGDVERIKLLDPEGKTFLGYSLVVGRELNSTALTLDSLPDNVVVGSAVGQGTDIIRRNYRWAGLTDHYFAMVAVPNDTIGQLILSNVQETVGETPRDYPSVAIPVRNDVPTRVFVGPKDRDLLTEASQRTGANLEVLIDYGIFASLIRPLLPLIGTTLNALSQTFGNYGWAIVVMTALINIALSPLRWFSSKKMKAAAKHQPRMKELQDKLKKLKESPKKNERELQQLQQEQIALMKEANPLGGCLPLLLQMPIFWAFFVYLTISLEVRQAPWVLWINDLSTPDPYWLLPIIMCVTMIAQTKLTPQPATADPSMKMQRVMMTYIMPLMLTWFFFLSAPSGLVLYWMVSNVVGVLIQLIINKMTAEPPTDGGNVTAASGSSAKGVPGGGRKETRKVAVTRKQSVERELIEGAK